MYVTIDGVRIGEWIHWPLVTSNYSATANLHNSQITTATAKHFPGFCVFTSRSLATASNSGNSSASRAQVLLSQTSHTTLTINSLDRPSCLQDNSSARTMQKPPISNSNSFVACVFVAAGMCLQNSCPRSLFTELQLSKCLYDTILSHYFQLYRSSRHYLFW
jgi:hypothetical protein